MRVETYLLLKSLITAAGFGDDITWAENITPCASPDDFAFEHAFVVCNSGMRAKTACGIFVKVKAALVAGRPLSEVFGHEHKCSSIQHVYDNREELYARFMALEDDASRMAFLRALPHIGPTIVYHLAKNFAVPVAKPDRHLVRISASYGTTTEGLCAALAVASGDKVPTVDTVIWRAASIGVISFDGDAPRIPSWPFDRDTVDFLCPRCGAARSANIAHHRREGIECWPGSCGECSATFYVEPTWDGLQITADEEDAPALAAAGQLGVSDAPQMSAEAAP